MESNTRDKLVNGEALSLEKFASPSREFGIMPFWFVNGEMDYAEMEYQLREYYNKGMPALYFHARFGIRDYMPYIGEEWFKRVAFTVEKAKEIGLQVWVYDEYNWPSGSAGQTIQKEDPELTEVYLQLLEGDLPGQFFTFMEGTDSRYNDMEDSEPVYACAIKLEDMKNGNFNYVDLMPNLAFDKVISWESPKGPWKQFYFIERKANWYTDVLNPKTTKRFIEKTHEAYKANQGGSFNETDGVQGFFTDEPAMLYFEAGKDNFIIPWSKQIFKFFRERNGYDLRRQLPRLFYTIGEESEQVRYDFWSTLSNQYDTAYYKQIGDWCKANGTIFTGHLLHEESLRQHCKSGGNLFHHLKHLDMTGIDHLYPRIGTKEMPNEHVAIKLASSAAHHFGSTRLVCESMGGSYWDCTMERMKWIADWEYVLGVNIFNPHGYHYSIEGERKRDWPPSQFYHHTWWEQYGLFNSYLSRMGYLLTGGHHVAKVAILYPISTIWANFTPQKRDKIGGICEDEFTYMTDRLLRLHMDFDYIDEDTLDNCEIEGGKLCIKGEQYDMLMLPPCSHIQSKTMDVIDRFWQAGGKIGGDAVLPYRFVDKSSNGLAARIEAIFGINPDTLHNNFLNTDSDKTDVKIIDGKNGAKAVFISGDGVAKTDAIDALKKAMLACITPEIEIDSEEVFYLHRVKDGRDFFFLINPTEKAHRICVTIKGEYTPELWNLENGDINPMHVYTVANKSTSFSLDMAAFGSHMVSAINAPANLYAQKSDIEIDKADGYSLHGYARLEKEGCVTLNRGGIIRTVPVVAKKPLDIIDLSGKWAFTTDKPNALVIGAWKMKIDDGTIDEAQLTAADTADWLDAKMGMWELQLPVERDEAIYPVDLYFVAKFNAGYVPDDLRLMVDGFKGSKYELYINGTKVTKEPQRSYLDAEIKESEISSFAKLGENTITLKLTARSKSDGLVDMLKIIGSFSVAQQNGIESLAQPITIIDTGDWVTQCYPYYSGTGIYTREIELPPEYIGNELILQAELGRDVLEVYVNGTLAQTRLWKPYCANLTALLKTGKNEIQLRVVNTLMNLLEATRNTSGLRSAEIVPYNRYTIDA